MRSCEGRQWSRAPSIPPFLSLTRVHAPPPDTDLVAIVVLPLFLAAILFVMANFGPKLLRAFFLQALLLLAFIV